MIRFLAKRFIKEGDTPQKQRQSYGLLCGTVGIVFNLLLFLGKFFTGRLSNSIAITADAFNNLSDAGSAAVTLAGFKLAGAKPDTEHPFGHGRMEYLTGLVVAAAILFMAFELIKDSIGKILHPEPSGFRPVYVLVLVASILVKLYMSHYNRVVGRQIASAAMHATATDSLSDALATTVVLASTLIGHFTGLRVDGYCGLLVGLFIFYAGVKAAQETLNPLLGQPPTEELVNQISGIVMAHKGVMGIHDLVVHDYGPGRQMISLHTEVPAEANILEIHDMIDRIEAELKQKLYCDAVIHMDPIVTDEQTERMRKKLAGIVVAAGENFSMHDFRMVPGNTHTNLIFDVAVPFANQYSDAEVAAEIQKLARGKLPEGYFLKIQIDRV